MNPIGEGEIHLIENTPARCKGIAVYMRDHARQLGLDPHVAAIVGWNAEATILFDDMTTVDLGRLLGEDAYRFAYEIQWQGDPKGLRSSMGVLLNIALLTVGDDGSVVGMAATLNRVGEEFGEDSPQYRRTVGMIERIKTTREWELLRTDTVDLTRLEPPIPPKQDGKPSAAKPEETVEPADGSTAADDQDKTDAPDDRATEFPPIGNDDKETEIPLPDFMTPDKVSKPVIEPAVDNPPTDPPARRGPVKRFLDWLGIEVG